MVTYYGEGGGGGSFTPTKKKEGGGGGVRTLIVLYGIRIQSQPSSGVFIFCVTMIIFLNTKTTLSLLINL